jgi:uncharacterized membrane protein
VESSPSREDRLVRSASEWLGGPIGRYALLGVSRWSPLTVVFLVTTAMFVVGILQKVPCHEHAWPRESSFAFSHMCYSDVAYLYRERGFAEGGVAYLDRGDYPALEYPVLTGVVMQVTAWLTQALGSDDAKADSVLFYDLTVLLLFGFALATGWALSRIHAAESGAHAPGRSAGAQPGRPYDAMFFAAAPTLALTGTINWDLLAVALTTGALLAWSRSRTFLAGVLLGLGAAAKFYPLFVLGPLLVLAVRRKKLAVTFETVGFAVLTWLLVNLPIMVLAPDAWSMFWTFNAQRQGDFGSIWYVLDLAGHEVSAVNTYSLVLFILACAGIAVLALRAPHPPRLAQLVFLTVAAFVIVNKVYSPQYVLWLLPLVALARPRWRDWLIWQTAELIYWAAIWLHLAGALAPAVGGQPDRFYWLAVGIRIAATGYLCVVVVRDILDPSRDVVRHGDPARDPAGGPFDTDDRWPAGIDIRPRHMSLELFGGQDTRPPRTDPVAHRGVAGREVAS